MLQNILVPVDFSEHSYNALEVAANLAKEHNAKLHIVHMMGLSDAVVTREESKQVIEAMFHMKLAEKRFNELMSKEYLKGVNFEHFVKNYTNFIELDDVASEVGAQLIVMGSHGSTGLQELFVGSNTEKVVRTATVPVLVIKEKTENFSIDKAVFATDFKAENLTAFSKVKEVMSALGAQTDLLYVNLPGERFRSSSEIIGKAREFVKASKDDVGMDNVTVYDDYSVESGIFNYSKENNVDLITVPTHGRRGLAHFFAGSIGEDIVNHSNLPVLSIKI
ncbi:MAG: universal stress protein [Gilvibacter sp.]